MKEKSEQETIVLLNRNDLDEGFFVFSTSQKSHFDKLCKRVGQENLISVRVDYDEKGNPAWYDCKVPSIYLSKTNFGVRTPMKLRRKLSPEEKEARSIRLSSFNTRKTSKSS